MELCNDVIDGLQMIGDSSYFDDVCYNKLLEIVYESLIVKPSNADSYSINGVKPAVVKQCHAACVTLVLEASKNNAHTTTISPILEDCKFTQDRIDNFNRMYSENKSKLQILLSSVSSQPPHVVDVDWKLDYCIKSRQVDGVHQPTFTIGLKTERVNQSDTQPDTQPVQFTCTQEQLQDLVGKLKDACKSLERSTQL